MIDLVPWIRGYRLGYARSFSSQSGARSEDSRGETVGSASLPDWEDCRLRFFFGMIGAAVGGSARSLGLDSWERLRRDLHSGSIIRHKLSSRFEVPGHRTATAQLMRDS